MGSLPSCWRDVLTLKKGSFSFFFQKNCIDRQMYIWEGRILGIKSNEKLIFLRDFDLKVKKKKACRIGAKRSFKYHQKF